jgi:hypothetical protein
MHTLAMFLGEEGLGTVLEQTPACYLRADAPSKASLVLHLLDLQGQLATLDHHVQDLLKAVQSADTSAKYH